MIIDVNAHFGSAPGYAPRHSREQLMRLLNAAGIDRAVEGKRIYPTYEPMDFADPAMQQLLAEAREQRFLQVYLRLQDPRVLPQAVPSATVIEALDALAEANPDVRFVVSGATYAEAAANARLFTRHNVWMDIAHVQHPTNSLEKLLAVIGSSRVLFGSNAPVFYPYANVFRVLNSKITHEDRDRILWKNALDLAGPEECNAAS